MNNGSMRTAHETSNGGFVFGMSSETSKEKRGAKAGMQNKKNIVANVGRGRNAGKESGVKSIKGGKRP